MKAAEGRGGQGGTVATAMAARVGDGGGGTGAATKAAAVNDGNNGRGTVEMAVERDSSETKQRHKVDGRGNLGAAMAAMVVKLEGDSGTVSTGTV